MKRIGILALTLCSFLTASAWTQQSAEGKSFGKLGIRRHSRSHLMQRNAVGHQFGMQPAVASETKVWDLGTYAGGTWAKLWDINDFGVAVGWGDVAGQTRMMGVPLFGPNAGNWFESGVSSQDDPWNGEGDAIADTGLVVGSITGKDGEARAYAWIPNIGGMELGVLDGDKGSHALAVNRLGTLIVGVSYPEAWDISTAVAWTPEIGWHDGRWTLSWKIHKLPTGGLDQPGRVYRGATLTYWGGWGVNDLGQIAGDAWSYAGEETALVWNPIHNGKDWEVQQLPHKSRSPLADHMYTEALAINNRGEIAGVVSLPDGWSAGLPAFWTMSPKGQIWSLTELPSLSGERSGWTNAFSINDLGDIVGCGNDADGNWFAARWRTKDPKSVGLVGFPGTWSEALHVNNNRIAVGHYGSDTVQENAVAVQLR